MDSISSKLSEFDDINITCSAHNLAAVGVCGNYLCKEKRFFCMKCVQSDDTCIILNRHELISLSELLYRFFIKQENKQIDLYEINSMMEDLKDIDRKEIINDLNEYVRNCMESITKSIDNFYENSLKSINKALEDNKVELKNINNKSHQTLSVNKDFNKFIEFNIPKCLINSNKQIIKEYLDSSNVSDKDKENFIYSVKCFLNYDNITKNATKLSEIFKLVKLTSSTDLEKKIDEKLSEIEANVFSKIDELEKAILPKKEGNISLVSKSFPNKFSSDPTTLVYKFDICENAHKSNSIDNVFCAFKCLKGESYVVWGSASFSIEVYDLKQEKVTKSISGAHTSTIFACRHYVDKLNKRDLIITSSYDKSVKVWSVKENWSNIVNIIGAHTGFYIYSVCILTDLTENKLYVISAAPNEYSKIWDFKGKHIKDFGVNNESTYFINSYYDNKHKKHYIINANSVDVKVYDFTTGLLYRSFKASPSTWHMSAMVIEMNGVQVLIESDGNGNMRLWDFHEGSVIKTISTSGINLRGNCLWNDQYVFSSGSDYNVKLYDIKNGSFVKNLTSHTSTACALDKIVHPKYGECLISHGLDGKLKLWSHK